MYEIFELLLAKHGVTPYRVAKETGIATATLSDWKKGRSIPKQDKLKKIADYFGVTIDYLMTGNDKTERLETELNSRDRRDISKDLDHIMDEIEGGEDSPLFYKGQPINEKHLQLLRNAIEIALEEVKKKNKETYTPKKYRKDKTISEE